MTDGILIEKYFCRECQGDCLLGQVVKDIEGASSIEMVAIMLRLIGEFIKFSKPEDAERDGELIVTDEICGGMVFCTNCNDNNK